MRRVGAPLRRPTPEGLPSSPVEGDVPVVFAIHADANAVAYNPSDRLTDAAAARDLWVRWDGHWTEHGFGYWAVTRLRLHGSTDLSDHRC
jgi:ribosomal-protein-alanine N-acetyltransferase